MEKWLRACLKNHLPLLLSMCLTPSNSKGIASSSPAGLRANEPPCEKHTEVLASYILKGWKSLSPGLRGTSYPGVGAPLNQNPERVLSKTLNGYLLWRRGLGRGGPSTAPPCLEY